MFETALLSARKHKLASLANTGRKGARSALKLLEDMDSMLASILLCNNFANVVVASLATVLAVRLFSDSEVVLSTVSVITTLTLLILAEITPKAIGVRFAERIACLAAPIILVIVRLLPIGKLMRAFINLVKRAIGKDKPSQGTVSMVAANELVALISDKHTLVEVDAYQKAMLYRVVGMHEQTLRHLMVGRAQIEFVDLRDPIGETAETLYHSRFNYVPLCNDGLENVRGMLDVRAALRELRKNPAMVPADLVRLARPPTYMPETLDPAHALRSIASSDWVPCLVVDEYGGLIGLVSMSDYSRQIFSADKVANGAVAGGDDQGQVLVPGDMLLRELNIDHSLRLPEDEARTVAGLIVERLGKFPDKVDEKVTVDAVTLEVAELDDLQIRQVRIRSDASVKPEGDEDLSRA